MKRIKLTVAYDGTDYCGWQIQKNGITVEEVLNRALSRLTGEEITVVGASRTDAGVHARGNVAVFDTDTRIPAERIVYAVNALLPEDVVVVRSEEVPAGWHPRKCVSVKTYEYRILNKEFPDPVRRRDTYFVSFSLDIERMRRAAEYLKGEHDFKSFCSAQTAVETTVRTIYDLDIKKEGEIITIRVRGNGFLYNMVRIIAGTLAGVGRGYFEPEDMERMLEAKDRTQAGVTAPPQGLTLVGIEYEKPDNSGSGSGCSA
ncbi:MAG TPA: tRNA pseudouridine(38-40) synthase TruA [Candidatus Mediterraneibacter stercorigallinarum]|uniref:tRNA pseudouridine synthase A n=1 Tax=Candidatus Mediterraneibacter stercorigallinarum TaxID=2838686 RepID=A0A9D2DBI4_9FIRM|nr:tRNA pseudouridine(38-40) synthase TruA [Candidatus Mediterraneibacter stercorigallinarum]